MYFMRYAIVNGVFVSFVIPNGMLDWEKIVQGGGCAMEMWPVLQVILGEETSYEFLHSIMLHRTKPGTGEWETLCPS